MRIPIHLPSGLAILLALTPLVSAQGQDELVELYKEKLSHRFVERGGWMTDYDAARARAKKEDKVLFVYFSRSYAP